MKLQLSQKSCALTVAVFFFLSHSFAQTRLIINGAKLNMDTAVILSVNDLTINNATLVVTPETKLKVAGAITTTSGLDASNGLVEMNGASNQQIPANTFTGNIIKYMILNSGAQVAVLGTLGLTDIFYMNAGSISGNGYFALKSTLNKTARVAPVATSAVVSSSGVVVERYIPAKRAFRFLTAPVNTPGDIHANWQENSNNTNPYVNINPFPGYGTHITGQGSSTNGFDATNTNNPSMFAYNNSSQAWVRVPNTFGQLHVGEPFRLMVRGDRSTDLGNNAPPASITTLRATGVLATGTVTYSKPGGSGTSGFQNLAGNNAEYSFVGNPYASGIDWMQLERTQVTSTMYIFDPQLSGANGRGAYVAYNAITGSNNPSSNVDNNIQSGQAFFIKNSGTDPLLTIRETHKIGVNRNVFRTTNILPHMGLQLLLPGQDTTGQSADAVSMFFDNSFSPVIGDEDAFKYINPDENLAILRNDTALCIEARSAINVSDTVPLKVWNLSPMIYMFRSVASNFDPSVTPYLEDKYLQNTTVLNNSGETFTPFIVTSDSFSYAKDRFRIVFRNASTLSIAFAGIKAYGKGKGIQVDWQVGSQLNMNKYEVEKSSNALQFAKIGEVKATTTETASYNWFDAQPFTGDNFYRIKSISNTGEAKYSAVVKVRITNKPADISIAANAATGNTLSVIMKNVPDGNYNATFISNAGQKLYSGNITHTAGSTETIPLNSQLAAGIYHLQVLISEKIYSTLVLVK